ncbi:helix-turn-helix transcriptional regulator [Streptomyces sp. S3(2020)]|uniref:helix-turn-helix domain-containing protein n=1 Tax=Streptomyces sp. S3(2020) TaxID=2732044 RepID=UPI001488DB91|nr:helix-turn-helix transcriptional regulator [Streptomyces sp. S3(2020)]NNN36056.1 helix-turn-helix transcriptional regulator [Streptomyces sp. S3(2020)]
MTTGRIELGASGRAVAANVKRLRKARGWSLRALSEALAAAGRGLSQDAINKIENGAEEDTKKQIRRVDVDDLVALAVVFGVNPSTLLLPDTTSGDAEITGVEGAVPATDAWKWADGKRPLRIPEGDDGTATLDFTRWARPQGLRNTFLITTPAGKAAALGIEGKHEGG